MQEAGSLHWHRFSAEPLVGPNPPPANYPQTSKSVFCFSVYVVAVSVCFTTCSGLGVVNILLD